MADERDVLKEWTANLVRVLTQTKTPRIELDTDWAGQPFVRIWERGFTRGGNPKWTPISPVLFGPAGTTTHAEVLTHLAALLEQHDLAGPESVPQETMPP